jgi:hypothetical protein
MNTMPQTLDERPATRAGFAVSQAAAQPAPARRKNEAHLKLVVDQPEAAESAVAAPLPYGLNGRRHLASVPARGTSESPRQGAPAQALAGGADNADMASPWPRRHLEPLAFALVLLVSVAALAVATRAG